MSTKKDETAAETHVTLDELLEETERSAEAGLPGGAVVLLGTKPRDEEARQAAMADYAEAKRQHLKSKATAMSRYKADPEYQQFFLKLSAEIGSYYKFPDRAGEAMMRLARPPRSVKSGLDKGADRVVARMLADPNHFGQLVGQRVKPGRAGKVVPVRTLPPPSPERLKTIINSLLALEMRLDRS